MVISGALRSLTVSLFSNQNAFGGSIQQEVFHDAATLDALSKQEESWREWPLRASDGDLAMLAQSTSEGLVSCLIVIRGSIDDIESQVDFRLDITGARAARVEVDWNSKKAGEYRARFLLGSETEANLVHVDDDHIETAIFTRFSSISPSDTEDAPASRVRSPSAEEDDVEGHGRTTEGTIACCRKYSDGQVNCDLCLNGALKTWALQSDTKEQEVAHRILDMLAEAGPAGLDLGTLIVSVYLHSLIMVD